LHYCPPPILTPLLIQKIIKHSQLKDQYIRVAFKRLTEAQILEDELTEVNALNKTLLAQKQELEAQLAAESRAKAGKYFICINLIMPE
jgi:HAMP domain-containing protein